MERTFSLARKRQIWLYLILSILCTALAAELSPILPQSISRSHVVRAEATPGVTKPFLLRIMPLGASITAGYGTNASDPYNGDGYRKPLRDQLRFRGWPVNMVGSVLNGSATGFHNRQNEGHGGFVVNQMNVTSDYTIPRQPNLVLINAGTNDADGGKKQDVPNTYLRMAGLIEHLYENIDDVTIILSTLTARKDQWNDNVNTINAGYRMLYQQLAAAGKKILLAEFDNGFLDPNTDYFDLIHPNALGAAKLAAVWDQAILEAEAKNFLTPPKDTGYPDFDDGTGEDASSDTTCDVVRGSGRGPVRTQEGNGADDGPWFQHEADINDPPEGGFIQSILGNNEGTSFYFAQLINAANADPQNALDECIYCFNVSTSDSLSTCLMLANVNGYYSQDPVILDTDLTCHVRGIRWGDVNGDGLADFICINLEGNMYVAINQGGNPPSFMATHNGGLIKEGYSWAPQERIRLGDIDGDGRLDYCAIDDKGDIYCWRNGGFGLAPTSDYDGYWNSIIVGEPTFNHQGEAEGIEGVKLVDINGDGRSDWVYVHKDGSTTTFVNQRGDIEHDGAGIRPHWEPAASEHLPFDGVTEPDQVLFGRVKGHGVADRVIAKKGDLPIAATLQVVPSTGHGGTKLKGDGVHYCDMFARGYDDYLWVLSTGAVTLYENTQSFPDWKAHGVIIDLERDRKSVHFGDWDGDGLCDILAVEQHTGRVEMWRNLYKTTGTLSFADPKWVVDSYDHLCTEGWGLGLYDLGLRFADLDGDNRVDYLCMEKNGRTIGSLNTATGLVYKDQIKLAPTENLDRANFRWADVNGDGLADLLWVNKYNGQARMWKNGGFTPAAGSSMTWFDQGIRFDGHGRGENIHFPKLGNKGRADYHDVYPATALANTWFNECSGDERAGEGVDDYPTPIDPDLPKPSGSSSGSSTLVSSTSGIGEPTHTPIDVPAQPTPPASFEDLIPKEISPGFVGETFTYELLDTTERYIEVTTLGRLQDIPEIDCGVNYVGGEDGDTLSCIAEGVAWLFFSMYNMGGPVDFAGARRDLLSGKRPIQTVQYHKDVHPQGNCTDIHCMIMSEIPRGQWISIGNGTSSHGIVHEHRVINHGHIVGHHVYTKGAVDSPTVADHLTKRQYRYGEQGFNSYYYEHPTQKVLYNPSAEPMDYKPWFDLLDKNEDIPPTDISDMVGAITERTIAERGFHELCVELGIFDRYPRFGLLEINYDAFEPSLNDISNPLEACEEFAGRYNRTSQVTCPSRFYLGPQESSEDDYEINDGTGPLPGQEASSLKRSTAGPSRLSGQGSSNSGTATGELMPRTSTSGNAESYPIRDVLHGTSILYFNAPTYPNGENGLSLQNTRTDGSTSAWAFATTDCYDYTLTSTASLNRLVSGIDFITEHIFPERQGLRTFYVYVQRAQMDEEDGRGIITDPTPAISFVVLVQWASVPYNEWATRTGSLALPANFPVNQLPATGSFFSAVADAIGSSSNPNVLVNLDAILNEYKAAIMAASANAISDRIFNAYVGTDFDATTQAIDLLRRGFGVFEYLNNAAIIARSRLSYRAYLAAAEEFDRLYGMTGNVPASNFAAHMPIFFTRLMNRVVNHHRLFLRRRLGQLAAPWRARLTAAGLSGPQRNEALFALDLIEYLESKIDEVIVYDITRIIT